MTVQLAPVVPTQVPPVHEKEVAAGLQLAVRVEVTPASIEAGAAVSVHVVGSIGPPSVRLRMANWDDTLPRGVTESRKLM